MNDNYNYRDYRTGSKSRCGNFKDTAGKPSSRNFAAFSWIGTMMLLLVTQLGLAQVSSYTFAQSSGTYTAITAGTLHGTAVDDSNYSFALPFTFTYNGTGYTTARPTTNGFLVLGGNAPSTTQYTPLSSGSTNFAIAGFAADLNSTVRSEVLGTSPNRIYVCQWSNAGRYSSGLQADGMNFQIRLYETTNVVQVIYGANVGTATSSTVQVGMRGTLNSDFNNRTSTTNWAATTAGGTNAASVTYSSAITPTSGLTFSWTPVVLSPCTTPTAQPTAIAFGTTTATAIAGSFTAASPAPSKYMVVRSTSATPPTAPTNGITYANGSTALGTGTSVVQSSSALTFSDSGLTAGTTYYYYVYSYNDLCSGAPFYLTVSPLSDSKTTICATGTSVGSNSIGATSANITWTGTGNYIVEYGATGFTPGTAATAGAGGAIASPSTTSPYALSGLTASTVYQVYVRQICAAGGYSANSSSHTFTTACAAITTFPSAQNFATYVPTCWTEGDAGSLAAGPVTVSGTAASWIADGPLNVGSTGAARINLDATGDNDWLISPFYTLPAGMRLTYTVSAHQWNSTAAPTSWEADDFVELVYSADMVNWTVLKTYNSTNIPSNLGQTDVVDLSGFSGQTIHFAFRGVEGATDGAADLEFIVDNFVVEAIPVLPPNCASGFVPADLAVNIPRNSTLTWSAATGSPSSYDVYLGTSPTPSFVGNVAGLSYATAVLAANTLYYWKIVPKNANGDAVGCTTQSFTTGADIVYCPSTYTSGPGTTDGVVSVTLGTLTNASGQNAVSPYYTFYNAVTVPNITQSAVVNVSITYGSDGTQYGGVWFDFNQDGNFDASEGFVSTVDADASGTSIIPVTVPAGAVLGNTRMRIRGGNDSILTTAQGCGASSSGFGETEDYIVNIIAMPTDTPDYVGLQFPASANILAGGSATIYGQVYEGGLTDQAPNITGQAPGIEAWVGVNATNTNPNTWVAGAWTTATWNSGHVTNNDEYQGNIGAALPAGTYYYAYRFRLNGGPYVYGGTDGSNGNFWNGTTHNSGVLTVNPNPTQCATTPVPASGTTNIPVGGLTLSWTAPASGPAPTSYDVYSGTTSGSLVFLSNVLVPTINVNVPAYSTTYYWRVTPKSAIGGDAAACAEWSFTTQADPFTPYCSTVTYAENVEPITSVNFAGINNQSSATVGPSTTQPAIQNFIAISGNVTTENSYTMTLKGNTDGGSFTNNFRVFIDWNQDGDFADANETYNAGSIVGSTGLDAVQAVSTIAVPAGALAGATRMRVKKLYSADTGVVTNPCTGGQYGQTEDYTLNVTLCTPTIWYADADGDTFGNPLVTQSACNQPVGYVANNTDCDDTNIGIYQTATFFIDSDNDNYDNGTASVCYGATTPVGYKTTTLGTDCNDADNTVWQSASLFVDADNDGYDNGSQTVCYGATVPAGFKLTTLGSDCNDGDNTVYQSATLFIDADNDNYDNGSQTVCYGATIPAGFKASTLGTDCNDAVAAINPGAAEVGYNGIDEDCDGLTDENGQLVTSLLSSICNTTLASIGSLIGITTVAGYPTITGYRVRATNGAQVQTIERSVPNFTMQMFTSFAYATTYTIDIELQRNGVWMSYYGPTCQISTPAILAENGAAQVSPSQCGIVLPKINTLIATTSIQGVTGYRFRVTNMTDLVGPNQVQTVTRTLNWFTLQMLTRYNYGTTYQIEVAVKTTGDFGGYGSPCEVSSPPAPSLINCSAVVAAPTTPVACTNLAGVTQYRFQVTRDSDSASTTIDRSNSFFTFNMVPAAVFTAGALYNVRVAVMTAGTWSPYGDVCQITAPQSLVRPAGESASESMVDFKAVASPNPFAADFGIDITTTSADNVSVKVYDMLGRMVESTEVKVSDLNTTKVGAQYPAGVYNVIVSQSGIVKTLRVIKR